MRQMVCSNRTVLSLHACLLFGAIWSCIVFDIQYTKSDSPSAFADLTRKLGRVRRAEFDCWAAQHLSSVVCDTASVLIVAAPWYLPQAIAIRSCKDRGLDATRTQARATGAM